MVYKYVIDEASAITPSQIYSDPSKINRLLKEGYRIVAFRKVAFGESYITFDAEVCPNASGETVYPEGPRFIVYYDPPPTPSFSDYCGMLYKAPSKSTERSIKPSDVYPGQLQAVVELLMSGYKIVDFRPPRAGEDYIFVGKVYGLGVYVVRCQFHHDLDRPSFIVERTKPLLEWE